MQDYFEESESLEILLDNCPLVSQSFSLFITYMKYDMIYDGCVGVSRVYVPVSRKRKRELLMEA